MKKMPERRTEAYRQKNTGIVANTVANVDAALLTYQLPTIACAVRYPVSVILLNIFPFS